MNEFNIKDLYAYLEASIEDFEVRLDRAIARGYKLHICPHQVDVNLTNEVIDHIYEYAEEEGLDVDQVEENIEDLLDSIYFM